MYSCEVRELGRIEYGEAVALQQRLVEQRKQDLIPDQLLLLEHPHTITLGRTGHLRTCWRASRLCARRNRISFERSRRRHHLSMARNRKRPRPRFVISRMNIVTRRFVPVHRSGDVARRDRSNENCDSPAAQSRLARQQFSRWPLRRA